MNFFIVASAELAVGFTFGWFCRGAYIRGLWKTSRKLQRKARGEK